VTRRLVQVTVSLTSILAAGNGYGKFLPFTLAILLNNDECDQDDCEQHCGHYGGHKKLCQAWVKSPGLVCCRCWRDTQRWTLARTGHLRSNNLSVSHLYEFDAGKRLGHFDRS
jgi:hypothetical protein